MSVKRVTFLGGDWMSSTDVESISEALEAAVSGRVVEAPPGAEGLTKGRCPICDLIVDAGLECAPEELPSGALLHRLAQTVWDLVEGLIEDRQPLVECSRMRAAASVLLAALVEDEGYFCDCEGVEPDPFS